MAVVAAVFGTPAVQGQQSDVVQLRVQWSTPPPGAAPAPDAQAQARSGSPLRLLERRSVPGSLPRQRNPQLSADQLVVRAFDERGVLIDSHLIPDPRLVRFEAPGPSGELSGEVLQRTDPDFLIALPATPVAVELRLYQPRWTGTQFALDLIGTLSLQ